MSKLQYAPFTKDTCGKLCGEFNIDIQLASINNVQDAIVTQFNVQWPNDISRYPRKYFEDHKFIQYLTMKLCAFHKSSLRAKYYIEVMEMRDFEMALKDYIIYKLVEVITKNDDHKLLSNVDMMQYMKDIL